MASVGRTTAVVDVVSFLALLILSSLLAVFLLKRFSLGRCFRLRDFENRDLMLSTDFCLTGFFDASVLSVLEGNRLGLLRFLAKRLGLAVVVVVAVIVVVEARVAVAASASVDLLLVCVIRVVVVVAGLIGVVVLIWARKGWAILVVDSFLAARPSTKGCCCTLDSTAGRLLPNLEEEEEAAAKGAAVVGFLRLVEAAAAVVVGLAAAVARLASCMRMVSVDEDSDLITLTTTFQSS